MCNAQIKRSQRLPKNPNNGQIPAWNNVSKIWEAVDQSGAASLPAGTNADDILLWDNIGEQYYSAASPFTTRSNPEIIDGDWLWNNTISFSGGIIDTFGLASPSSGYTTGADLDGNLFIKNRLGAVMTWRTDSISSDVIYNLPTETGTIALKGKTGIHFDSDANVSASLQVLKDPANNNLPISVSSSQVSISGASGNTIFNGNTIEMTRNSANYFHASSVGGDFRWTVNGNALANPSMNLTNAGNLLLGHTTASARLHVRGDGTNNIIRFETGSGLQAFAINANGGITIARDGNIGPAIYPFNALETSQDILGFGLGFTSNKVNFAPNNYDVFFGGQNITTTSGIANILTIRRFFTATAGTASFRPLNIEYTINNSGVQTGGATSTGIFLNATETALNGMNHNLMDLQRNNSSRFRVDNTGNIFTTGGVYNTGQFGRLGVGFITFLSDGVVTFANASETGFNRLQFTTGASTNIGINIGSGSPEGVITARTGSVYLRTDGDAMTSFYVKGSGTGNTGWVAK